MIKDSINDVSDSLKTTMRMPWSSLWLTRRVLNLAHLIEMDKWIKVGEIYSSECPSHGEAFALKSLRSCSYALYATNFGIWIHLYSRQDSEITDCYRWHLPYSLLLLLVSTSSGFLSCDS
jgi:hypothetical protein